jgi:FkbM family methyltransferase
MSILKAIVKLVLGRGVWKSYSQYGEDMIVSALFRSRTPGFYVDIGAYHPVLYSTTYALYRRGWRGLVIDPNRDMQRLFGLIRPRDTFVPVAIGEEGSGTYHAYEDGAYNSLSEEQVAHIRETKGVVPQSSRSVQVRPLSAVLREYNVTRIDYMNIDVEGMDLAVLESHAWDIRPRVISVEDASFSAERAHDSAIYDYLIKKGYELRGLTGLTLIFKDVRTG